MSPPKSRHSEPRNTHMPSFSFEMPVVVTWPSACCAARCASTACNWSIGSMVVSVNERSLLVGDGLAAIVAIGRGILARMVATGVVVVAGVRGFVVDRRLHDPAVDRGYDEHTADD